MLLITILVAACVTAAPADGAMHGQGWTSSTARLLLQANQLDGNEITASEETPVQKQYHRKYAGGGHHHDTKHTTDVCIIGAGASGLAAALRLRQKRYKDVVILERNAFPGGKAITLKVEPNSTSLYIAALLGYYKTYANTVKLLDAYQVPTATFQSDNYLLNDEAGLMIPTAAFPSNQNTMVGVLDAFAKYSALYDGLKGYLVPGYINGVPPELQLSFGSWLRANGLEPLFPFGYLLVTAYGYGSLESIPAAYGLTCVTPEVLEVTFGGATGFYTDYALLWQRAADDLADSGVRIKYGVNITEVKQRHGDISSRITYTTANKHTAKTQRCRHIIAAFPPNQASLEAFDLDAQQRAVLDRVRFVQYISGVINLPNANTAGRFGVNTRMLKLTGDSANPLTLTEPPGDGLPALFLRFPNTSVATFYSWIAGNTSIPESTLAQQSIATMSLFNRPPGGPLTGAIPLTPTDLRRLERWVYFAHFDVSAISSGVFSQLEALQGHRGTFFTGSLRTFETMESAVMSAYDIVDRYF